MPISGYAQIHNINIASNGAGQFYNRLGEETTPEITFNFTNFSSFNKKSLPAVPVNIKTVDLDSTVLFYGGPGEKRKELDAILAAVDQVHTHTHTLFYPVHI